MDQIKSKVNSVKKLILYQTEVTMNKKIVKALAISTFAITTFCALGFAITVLDWSSRDALTKSINYWIRKPAINQNRNLIFCETLKPGMDRITILDTLQQFGEFTYSEFYWGPSKDEGYSEIVGNYLDEQIAGRESVILSFQDGKYSGTSIVVFVYKTESVVK